MVRFNGYRLRPLAEDDLERIWLYSAEQWSLAQADSYIRDIFTACDDLAQGRRTGRAMDGIAAYLSVPVGAHRIWFRPATYVDVVRILHQSMDVGSHL